MNLPAEFWQLPAIAVIAVVVIGYLLWANREQRKEAQAERQTTAQFLQNLIAANEAERKANTKCLTDLVERSTKASEQTATAISKIAQDLARELERHDRDVVAELREIRAGGRVPRDYTYTVGGERAE